MSTQPFGVYLLGNDPMSEWLEAVLRSLRRWEPDTPVMLIPFDKRLRRTRKLARAMNVDIWDDPSFPVLDDVGRRFYPNYVKATHAFRKFAIFWGPFDRFLFLDADMVVLGPYLSDLLRIFDTAAIDLLYWDADLSWVYADPELRDRMVREHGSRGFNTGTLLSRSGLISLDDVLALAPRALAVRAGLAEAFEQPLINFISDHKKLKVRAMWELSQEFSLTIWRRCQIEQRGDSYWQPCEDGLRRLPFLHWSGARLPHIEHEEVFLSCRLHGQPRWWALAYRCGWRCAKVLLRHRRTT
jgi:hypothetical protein